MTDGLGRTIDYLRLSVTDRCNLRCTYCMPREGVEWVHHSEILSYEDLLHLCRIFRKLGVHRVRLTGGEPLVRKGLARLVDGLKTDCGMERVTLTTNGLLLAAQLPELCSAGLDGVNISLDAVDEGLFQSITRCPGADVVLDAIDRALSMPRLAVKLNCVPLGCNDDQLLPLAELARSRPLAVRFIELMPIGLAAALPRRSEGEVRALLGPTLGPLQPLPSPEGGGPCRYYRPDGFVGSVGFISAVSHQFCQDCNRVRLTAGGFLKTCLQYDAGVALAPLLQTTDAALTDAIAAAIAAKPAAHHFGQCAQPGDEGRGMSQIGG